MAEPKIAQEAAKELANAVALNLQSAAVSTGDATTTTLVQDVTEPTDEASVLVLVQFEKAWGLYNKGEKATVGPAQAVRLIQAKIAVKA